MTISQPVDASVLVELIATAPRSAERLEADAVAVLEVLEGPMASVALGAVVGCNLETPAIELKFDVLASTPAEVQHRIGAVMEAVQGALGADHEVRTRTVPAAACTA